MSFLLTLVFLSPLTHRLFLMWIYTKPIITFCQQTDKKARSRGDNNLSSLQYNQHLTTNAVLLHRWLMLIYFGTKLKLCDWRKETNWQVNNVLSRCFGQIFPSKLLTLVVRLQSCDLQSYFSLPLTALLRFKIVSFSILSLTFFPVVSIFVDILHFSIAHPNPQYCAIVLTKM